MSRRQNLDSHIKKTISIKGKQMEINLLMLIRRLLAFGVVLLNNRLGRSSEAHDCMQMEKKAMVMCLPSGGTMEEHDVRVSQRLPQVKAHRTGKEGEGEAGFVALIG